MPAKQDEILKEIESKAKEEHWPIIGSKKGQVFAEVISKYHPKRVLEIGMLVGYSAILMSKFLDSNAKIITIEINPKIAEIAARNFKKAGIENMLEIKVGDALEILPKLSGPFDLVFLDAAKEQYLAYFKAVEKKLSPQAVVVADNVKIFAEAMSDYLEYVRKNYQSQIYDFGFDAVEVSIFQF